MERNTVKKAFSLLAGVLFAVGLVGCEQQKEAASSVQSAEATKDAAELAAEKAREEAAAAIQAPSHEGH